jgi:hypothetical protein
MRLYLSSYLRSASSQREFALRLRVVRRYYVDAINKKFANIKLIIHLSTLLSGNNKNYTDIQFGIIFIFQFISDTMIVPYLYNKSYALYLNSIENE